jgi:Fe-S oxidoreductase
MGLIHWWAGLATRMPRVVNALAHAPLLSGVLKAVGGIAPEREVPRFAEETFRSWWRRRPKDQRASTGGTGAPRERVVLWVDTFNDHFHPQVAQAAVKVLEAAGREVVVPERALCCGRPLYDWGYLGQAKRLLRTILADQRDEIRAGTPIVGLEPSCVSVFRDEATNLLHGDNDARRLAAQTKTLGEFLANRDGYKPPHLEGQVLVHGHCHDKSVLGFESEMAVLRASGLEVDAPDSGCCGMAGSFGFERGDHYRVAMAVGERALLPAVRKADPGTFIVADGFSCREQIEQGTTRSVIHLAELLATALEHEAREVTRDGTSGPA